MNDWKRRSVADLISNNILIIGDGYRAMIEEFSSSGLPFARASNINNGFDFNDVDFFPENKLNKVGNKISEVGDVVFTSKGTVGRFAFVTSDIQRFVYSPQLCFWRVVDTEVIDPRFLYFWMSSREFFLQFNGVKGQTDMADYVSLTDQRRMYITLPPIPEQRAIAGILGALDDKIELNKCINHTLESISRAIFRDWFVDNKEEQGWKFACIGDIADVIDCLHSRKPDRQETGKPLLQLSNILDNGLLDISDIYFITKIDYDFWISRIEASPGDCVITNVGRVGAVAQIPQGFTAALGRNMTAVRCKKDYPYPTFLLECLLSDFMRHEIINKTDTGTILDALNVKNIPLLQFRLPPYNLLKKYEGLVRPIRKKMELNQQESYTLASLRDSLLPKLMKGEIRVEG
jgi:type I restriction enzyme S subunit